MNNLQEKLLADNRIWDKFQYQLEDKIASDAGRKLTRNGYIWIGVSRTKDGWKLYTGNGMQKVKGLAYSSSYINYCIDASMVENGNLNSKGVLYCLYTIDILLAELRRDIVKSMESEV